MIDNWDYPVKYTYDRTRKGTKVYRSIWMESGPPLVKKYIVTQETDRRVILSLDNGSGNVLFTKEDCVPSLLRQDPFGLENFLVAYSANKKGRWRLMTDASKNILSLQDSSNSVRVSAARQVRIGRDKYVFVTGLFDQAFSIDFDVSSEVVELHTVASDEKEIHRSAKISTYKALSSKPNPPKKKKKRRFAPVNFEGERNENFRINNNDSNGEESPLWMAKLHLLYFEYSEKLSKRLANMNRALRRRSPTPLRHKIKRYRKAHRTNYRFGEDEQNAGESEQVHFGAERYGETARCSSESIDDDLVSCKNVSIAECIVQPVRRKGREKRKRHSSAHFEEPAIFEPKECKVESPEGAGELPVVEPGTNLEKLQLLESNIFSVTRSFLNNEVLKIGMPVDGLLPSTFAVNVYDPFESSKGLKLPDNFRGVLLLQKLRQFKKKIHIRCLFNPFDFVSRYPEKVVGRLPKAKDTKFHEQKIFAKVKHIYPQSDASIFGCGSLEADKSAGEEYQRKRCCGNCFEDDRYCIALKCGHFFCEYCWLAHIKTSVYMGQVPVTCLDYSCNLAMNREQMMLIAPVDFCYRYNALVKQKLLTENLNKKHRWFKCESCETVNEVTNEEAKNLLAQCSCGYTVYTLGSDQGVVRIAVRQCPQCKVFCQRSHGCDHMTCTCGQQFCYKCCQKLSFTNDHDNCVEIEINVDLIDAPKSICFIPKSTYEQCLYFQAQNTPPSFNNLRLYPPKNPLNSLRRKHINFVVHWAYTTLEFCCVQTCLKRRRLNWTKRNNLPFFKLACEFALLNRYYHQLQFLVLRLKQLCEYDKGGLTKLEEYSKEIENAILRIFNISV
ncbi:unnamed protein product [Enterobius vermicularis]|uniref:RING-type domain-containing protein n=1 Tax=Enterobius vermicularis TaxID=51028 RepID=A0A0N4V7Y4_ENTVE|nr:unnamed protein product [Enterobius vermicularis]